MTFEFPYTDDRLMGSVHRVDGNSITMSLPRARGLPGISYGARLGLGEVGEFVVVDIGGEGILARILEVSSPDPDFALEPRARADESRRAYGSAQLLCTIGRDGSYLRGLVRHPRIGDKVFSASPSLVAGVIAGIDASLTVAASDPRINIGHLSASQDVDVVMSASRFFGRHLAIVGATGGGKSWSLARLMEEVGSIHGRLLLIDATGEFHTLGNRAIHWSLAADEPSEVQAGHAYIPHHEFNELDRFAFLRPSSGVQLPKLRAAIRSLRLAHILTSEGSTSPVVGESGLIRKAKTLREPIIRLERDHESALSNPHAPFDLSLLPDQIRHECVYDTDLNDSARFGNWNMQEVGYVASLCSRIYDLLQTRPVVGVINPEDPPQPIFRALEDWMSGAQTPVFRLSLQDLPFSHYLREILVNTIGSRLLTMARAGVFKKNPIIVAVDEAHQFFGKTVGDEFAQAQLDSFDLIAKEGRKYGLTVCMATQRPGDIPAAVLSQAGMLLVHRLADRKDRERVEEACSELDSTATRLLPALIPGEALLVGADFPVPLPVIVRAPERPPASRGPDYSSWGSSGMAKPADE